MVGISSHHRQLGLARWYTFSPSWPSFTYSPVWGLTQKMAGYTSLPSFLGGVAVM